MPMPHETLETLEKLAQQLGWVIKYSADGTPSIYYPLYKCKSSDLDPSLPNHTHPAFIVNGVEIPRRLIAVYKGSSRTDDGASAILSLPNMPPRTSASANELLAGLKQAGSGFGPKTVADSGLLLLLARKYNWNPKGNNNLCSDVLCGTAWRPGVNITLGCWYHYLGWEYEALKTHVSTQENRPDRNIELWKRVRIVGGIPVDAHQDIYADNGDHRTYTGSGPASWRHDGTPEGIDDLTGNCFEVDYGYRIVNGEIQIVENNNAADPSADLSENSTAWRAILPNQSNNAHTLVAPGTAGTLKLTYQNGSITLDTSTPTLSGLQTQTPFKALAVNTVNVPYVPAILQELGIFPITGDDTSGLVKHLTSGGELMALRGGYYASYNYAGLGCVHTTGTRNDATHGIGVRGAYLEEF